MTNTTEFADKLSTAIKGTNFIQKSYVWKGRKEKDENGNYVQTSVNLMDATPEQLQSFYNHCVSMLYNKDAERPGRRPLLTIVQSQRDRCGVELFLRECEADGTSRYSIIDSIKQAIRTSGISQDEVKSLTLSSFINVGSSYKDLPIKLIQEGCINRLGKFDKTHITKTFILKQGLRIAEFEENELTEYKEDGTKISFINVAREKLSLKDHMPLRIDSKGLTFTQLRAMLNLKNRCYNDLSSDQLKTLRYHLLFTLEDDILFHIEQWETRIDQIREVAELRGIQL